jgi:hypothetical protein
VEEVLDIDLRKGLFPFPHIEALRAKRNEIAVRYTTRKAPKRKEVKPKAEELTKLIDDVFLELELAEILD